MTDDFYDLLGVPPDASQRDIKDAYREKVRRYHPDVNDDDRARAQFTAITKANEILSDPVERRAYDRLGHQDYVSKRTSGIPSPSVWATDDESDSDGSATSSESSRSSTGRSRSRGTTQSTSSRSGADATTTDSTDTTGSSDTARSSSRSSTSRSAKRTSSTTTTSTTSTETSSRSGTRSSDGNEGRTNTRETGKTSRSTSGRTGAGRRTSTGQGSTASDRTGTTARAAGSAAGATGAANTTAASSDAASGGGTGSSSSRSVGGSRTSRQRRSDSTGILYGVVDWWRRRNFAPPLLWSSLLVYLTGLVHFGLENESGIRSLGERLVAAGAAPGELLAVLTSSRYGIQTPVSYVVGVEPVTRPLEPLEWYAALAGIVAVAVVIVGLTRVAWRAEPLGPITIDETIVLAFALGLSSWLLGGPLLAGATLMPFLFGVVVHYTRRRVGWTPSYLYVVPSLGPLAGLAAGYAGYTTLPLEVVAFVVLPLAGGLALPLRAAIRKQFGR